MAGTGKGAKKGWITRRKRAMGRDIAGFVPVVGPAMRARKTLKDTRKYLKT